jgi:hypothetical protein
MPFYMLNKAQRMPKYFFIKRNTVKHDHINGFNKINLQITSI